MRLEERWKQIVASPSKSFAAALVCFSLGVGAATLAGWTAVATPLAVAVVGFGAWALLRDKRSRLVAIVVACFALGLWRYGVTTIPPSTQTVVSSVGTEAVISGRIAAEVEPHGRYRRAVLDDVAVASARVDGKLLVWLDAYPPAFYGDTLSFVCAPELPEPIDGFAYDEHLRAQGIVAVCNGPSDVVVEPGSSDGIVATLLSVKRVVIARLGQVVPEPHASFLAGLIFGGSSSLSSDLKDDFSKTGMSHILAASGFNVSLFSLVFLNWVTHTTLGRRRGTYLTVALLLAYVVVAGATAAVVRAGIMGLLVLVGFAIHRKPSVLNVTLVALAGMLLWNPLLLADVGFQLSFVATAALLAASAPIEKRCGFVPEAFELRKSFAGSLAAIVFTFPILLWHFGTVSLWSPVVNLLVLPLVPMLMSLTGIAIVVGFLSVPLGVVVATPAWAASSVILHLVTWFGAL